MKSFTADRPPGWNWGIVPVWVLERHLFPETAGNQGGSVEKGGELKGSREKAGKLARETAGKGRGGTWTWRRPGSYFLSQVVPTRW